MREKSLDFLKRMLNTPSPSGFEEEASEIWRQYVGAYQLITVNKDTYGNSIAEMTPATNSEHCISLPSTHTIMLCGHIDEVGMMIHYINDDGFIYVSQIGGFDALITLAQRVTIHNKNGHISGVIGRKPIHLADDDEEEVKLHTVFIDIGAKDKEDAMNMVSVGDPVTFDAPIRELANNRIAARGLDDRMGAWVVAETMRRLSERSLLKVTVVGVATVQEENGAYGAIMAAKRIKPSVAVAIDVTHATDVPDISKEEHGDCILGGGPVLSLGSISHKKVNALLETVAGENRIKIQKQISPRWSGTDADAIFTEAGGIPTALVSVPNRYMHTPTEMIQLDDLEDTVELLVRWCESIDDNTIF